MRLGPPLALELIRAFERRGTAEVEARSKDHFAIARVVPKKTGSYYLIVEVEKSPLERTTWSLAYGFR